MTTYTHDLLCLLLSVTLKNLSVSISTRLKTTVYQLDLYTAGFKTILRMPNALHNYILYITYCILLYTVYNTVLLYYCTTVYCILYTV